MFCNQEALEVSAMTGPMSTNVSGDVNSMNTGHWDHTGHVLMLFSESLF